MVLEKSGCYLEKAIIKTYTNKLQGNRGKAAANTVKNNPKNRSTFGLPAIGFLDNRPAATAQRKIQVMADNKSQVRQLRAFGGMANNSSRFIKQAQIQETMRGDNSTAIQRHTVLQLGKEKFPFGSAGSVPHVSTYSGGSHLKIVDPDRPKAGVQRYNIEKNGMLHPQHADAIRAATASGDQTLIDVVQGLIDNF